MQPLRKSNLLLKGASSMLTDLPAPINLSLLWNFGSMLGLCLSIQLITGILLTIHYAPNVESSFSCIAHITRDVNWGWLLRNVHMNGASMFFACMYLHMGRNIYYESYKLSHTWMIGVTIYIMTMATAFMGYLLPWGQMSFWGATVITNLFSAAPYIGGSLVEWLWGGFGVSNPTLTRFFTFHFLLPFMIAAMVIIHLLYLHTTGSSNPIGVNSNHMKTPFHYMYTTKDLMSSVFLVLLLTLISMYIPAWFGDPENFIPANPLLTPTHIKPEWYFLWAYAILRSVPNKLGGVVCMFGAILILYLFPLTSTLPMQMYIYRYMSWTFFMTMIILTWIGGSPVEPPYDTLGMIFTSLYFVIILIPLLIKK